MPKVSVIVPIFKAEKYIEKCAVSLLSQTLDNIEYIFIDDCTPDRSMELFHNVLKKFPARARDVRTVRMPSNSGLAAVRRKGIQLATGDYIIHCDSDDWVDTDLYEKMYNKAVDTQADVIICPVVDEYSDRSVKHISIVVGSGKDIVRNWYFRPVAMFTVNKLVKRSVIIDNDILPFEGINMWEDNGLMLRVLYYCNKADVIEDAVYHYFRANENAITHNYGSNAVDQMLRCARNIDAFFKSKPDSLNYKRTVDALKFYARINLITTSFSRLREYYHTFPDTDYIIRHLPRNAFSLKGIIRYHFVRCHLAWLFVLLFKVVSWVRK